MLNSDAPKREIEFREVFVVQNMITWIYLLRRERKIKISKRLGILFYHRKQYFLNGYE